MGAFIVNIPTSMYVRGNLSSAKKMAPRFCWVRGTLSGLEGVGEDSAYTAQQGFCRPCTLSDWKEDLTGTACFGPVVPALQQCKMALTHHCVGRLRCLHQ